MLIKAIVCRSNPHSIREIYVAGDVSVEKFIKALPVCFGVSYENGFIISGINCEYAKKESVRESFTGDNYLLKNRIKAYPDIRLEIINREDIANTDAMTLNRYRGYNIPGPDAPLSACNRLWSKIKDGYGFYSEKNHEWINENTYIPRPADINKRIKRALSDEPKLNVDRSMCVLYKRTLEEKNVSELKQLSVSLGIQNYTNQRKFDLIDDIYNEITGNEFFYWYIDICRLSEYLSLKKLCLGKVEDYSEKRDCFNSLVFLSSFYLADGRKMTLAEEIVDMMEEWLDDETGEENYILIKKICTVIEAGCRLYGFVNEAMSEKLFEIAFPNEDSSKVGEYWGTFKMESGLTDINYYEKFYYIAKNITSMEAKLRSNIWNKDLEKWYIPTAEEIINISEYGLTMEETKHEDLVGTLRLVAGRRGYMARGIASDIVEMIHLGNSTSDIMRKIKSDLGYYNHYYSELEERIESGRNTVRMMKNNGFTDEEMTRGKR